MTRWNQFSEQSRPLVRAAAISFTFFLVELGAGLACGSLAILSDSVHMFIDVVGYTVAVAAVEVGCWEYTFGFARVELIGALISLFLTWNLCFGLIAEAHSRFERDEKAHELNPKAMFFGALFGVAANTFMALMLQPPHGHEHLEHDHNHDGKHFAVPSKADFEMHAVERIETATLCGNDGDVESQTKMTTSNINVQAAMMHIAGDLLGSVSILVASIVLMLKPEWTFIDPMCTIVFAIIIFISSLGFAKQYVMILMERVPDDISIDTVQTSLLQLPGVSSIDTIKIWSLTQGKDCCILSIRMARQKAFDEKGEYALSSSSSSSRKEETEPSCAMNSVFAAQSPDVEVYSGEDPVSVCVAESNETGENYFSSSSESETLVAISERNGQLEMIRAHLKEAYGFHEIYVEIRHDL
ncbi:hypothetical protein HK100_005989 [Physocladia obscura]|uniref:Cation efflux protein transmembrane domain-containing protein n=1 Tax=Physocladia obscura TaxID=109957 RepID=A0AAD5SQU9_9FUNG|nr:hypothetical protein HK100_005989 [Physocladia obscura]